MARQYREGQLVACVVAGEPNLYRIHPDAKRPDERAEYVARFAKHFEAWGAACVLNRARGYDLPSFESEMTLEELKSVRGGK